MPPPQSFMFGKKCRPLRVKMCKNHFFYQINQSIEVVEKIFLNKMQKTTRRGGFQPPTPSKGRVNAIGTILKSKYSFLKNVEKNTKKKKKSMLTLNKDYILNTI